MTGRAAARRSTGDARRALAGRVLLGAGTATAAAHLPPRGGSGAAVRWQRVNHRGRTVSLAAGPALALAAAATGVPQPAAAVAGVVAGALGAYDDVVGAHPQQRDAKGLRGHLRALRAGHVTAGSVKLAGLVLTGLAAGLLAAPRARSAAGARPARGSAVLDAGLAAGVVSGSANLLNLFDLRPGRALKVGLVAALVLRQPGPAAAAVALLPDDLGERSMLGDTGANALGAVLGVAVVDRLPGRGPRAVALAVLAALTAASEVVSYSRVIEAVPVLRALDALGRRA